MIADLFFKVSEKQLANLGEHKKKIKMINVENRKKDLVGLLQDVDKIVIVGEQISKSLMK